MMNKKKIITSQWESQQILKSPAMKAFNIVPYLITLQEASKENLEELISMTGSFLSFMNDDQHLLYRKVLVKPMSIQTLELYRKEIQKSISQALDGFIQERQPDLVKHFTDPLYIKLLNNLFGLHIEDETTFLQDIVTSTRITEPMLSLRELKQLQNTYIRLKKIVEKQILEQKCSGVLNDICESGKELLSHDELMILLVTMVIASRTTTESLVCILCEYGKLDKEVRKKRLSDEWLSQNVDHLIRLCASTQYLTRVATESVTFGDLHIEKGEQIFIDVPKANRDTSFYGTSIAFDQDPSSKHSHITFGGGTHICPGLHMGKLVILLTVPQFFTKIASLECMEDEMTYQASTSAKRATSCPVAIEIL